MSLLSEATHLCMKAKHAFLPQAHGSVEADTMMWRQGVMFNDKVSSPGFLSLLYMQSGI